MTKSRLLLLVGGLVAGFVIAVLFFPVVAPDFLIKPFGFYDTDRVPNGFIAPNGSYSKVPPADVPPGTYYSQPFMGGMMGPGMMGPPAGYGYNNNFNIPSNFKSNGQRIYFTATSNSGKPISARMMGMEMTNMRWGCAYCHGPEGQGQTVVMHIGTWKTPKISYKYLTSGDHGDNHDSAEGHAYYTERTIKRAIIEGINPDGVPLGWPMPRWRMSDGDLEDLVEYLKELP